MNDKDKILYVIEQKGKCRYITCWSCPLNLKCNTFPYTEEAIYKLYKIAIQHVLEQRYLSEQELFDLIL